MAPAKAKSPKKPDATITNNVTVCNERGLHARAASKFVKLVAEFTAEVTVTKGSQSVAGSSILGLMMLAAGPGTEITIATSGSQAAEASAALCGLVEARFEE
ncbi:MAG: HPr family phosphocarrier protein [Rhodospirillales bacterium]|jgi:phosphocarrier protein HPr|nr:HPr family phosphocarrier protein [Rhodospirillales bacterium]